MNKLTELQKSQGYKILKCPHCKEKTLHTPHGFENNNRRWSCGNCEEINYQE